MQKRILLFVILCLILTATLYTFGTAPLTRIMSNTWRVGFHEQFASIQEAIDYPAVIDGDIIEVRYNATPYYENVTVYKSVTIRVDEIDRMNGHLPIVDGINKKGAVFRVNVQNVEIDGFIIRNGMYGIWLWDGNNSIRNNYVNSNSEGIFIDSTSANNIIYNNTVTSNNRGIFIFGANNNLAENRMNLNQNNLSINRGCHDQIINVSNTVNNKPVYYLSNKTDYEVPSEAGFVGIVNSTRITVNNLTLENNSQGVLIADSSEILVRNVTTVNARWGSIDLYQSHNNLIKENTFLQSDGIILDCSDNNTIVDNEMILGYAGSQWGNGIFETNSADNVIVANNISYSNYAFTISQSNRTAIFHNNIFDAVTPLFWENGSEIHFDNGYEGNYWNNYEQKYPNASEIDQFGIWNTPYSLATALMDNCPLVIPWTENRTLSQTMVGKYTGQKLYTFGNSTIGSLGFNRSSVEITLKATSGYSGFMNVTIPRGWIDNPFNITVDGAPAEFLCNLNSTCSFLYINYGAGMHTIRITGTELGSFQGDVNRDGKVNILDIVIIAVNFGAREG